MSCNCEPICSPCANNCPDDWEILQAAILDPEDCNTNCCWKSCSDNCWINIQSTNDCLVVDTSECWVIKLTAECPKPTYVTAGDNITVKEITPPDDCYMDWWDCDIKGWWEVSATDEKVKACSWDTTPGALNKKLKAGNWIVIDEVGCWWWNAYLKIGIADWIIPECEEPPELVINNGSKLLNITQSWDHRHIVTITDNRSESVFDNTAMVWFTTNKDYAVDFNNDANAKNVTWIETSASGWGWDIFTGNRKLVTKDWIKIQQSGYYRIYWQLTVMNNVSDNEKLINLGRALVKIEWSRPWFEWHFKSLITSKHWAYWTWIIPKWWQWIQIAQDGTFSVTGATSTTADIGGTSTVKFNNWWWQQPWSWFDWPWATHNIWCFVDLREWDVITLWYRPQSDIPSAKWRTNWATFRLTWVDDSSTEFGSLFWWTALGVQLITPTLFQNTTSNKIVDSI